jgi:peroxiredoxin Q/BCP
MTVSVGERAPAFSRTAHDGVPIELGAEVRERVMVLYFYPKDETAGCTAEACRFRDHYADFVDAGATVVGVSPDPPETHRAFAEHHRLPFHLISDDDGSLRKAYGVGRTLGWIPGRITFVIDRQGTVQHVFNSQLQARRHVDEALRVVRRLSQG